MVFFIQGEYILIIQTIAGEYFPRERLIAATFADRKGPSVREKQNCTVAELNGLNCKCADVFIAGPETNERARDGPGSLWELIEVAAHLQLAAPPEMLPLNPINHTFLPFPLNTTNKLPSNYENKAICC